MGRYTGSKNKLSRREGLDLFGIGGDSLRRRIEQPPGDHGTRMRRGRPSDFQRQLREKQKVKRIYGMRERQFRRFVGLARNESDMTGTALLRLLERRLDSTVYKAGLARSRPMARQLIVHGHVKVNGRKVDVPSFLVEPGDAIGLDDKALKMPDVDWAMQAPSIALPSWLSRDGAEVHVIDWPTREEVEFPIKDNLIVEFYSR
ncbi:MAG: 30S ribosomal protein S4 [Anaerolineae bacterium]